MPTDQLIQLTTNDLRLTPHSVPPPRRNSDDFAPLPLTNLEPANDLRP